MEVGGAGDGLLILVKDAAALRDDSIQIIDRIEISVHQRLIDERPQMLGRLQLRAVGGLIDQANAVGDGKILWAVPARVVEHDDNDALAAGAGLAREGAEQFGKERLVDAVREVPHGLTARRRHERGEIKPFVAMMAERDRALADWRPDAPMDRLQAEAMLIRRP
jgi:hypothetical protein